MRALGLVAATIVALLPLGHSAAAHSAAPPLVSASRDIESTITIALIDTHRPVSIEAEAAALTGDVNSVRAKHGLRTLTRDAALDRVAYSKAVDMAARGYFGHTSPDGVTFQDRMRAARWPSQYVSENIAFDVDEPAAHRAFVNSPPHFANLVDPNQRRIGVAVVTVGTGETFYVEDFSD